ncbi:hypothetical protein QUA13_24320 [Microcoleus sp. S28C3]|uniref:hypothetical protein n=1 Tax=Microcoleus sp. S28C3 TaxID=3055414 RepID=UPI002FD39B51
MITDEELTPIDLSDFWEEEELEDADTDADTSSNGIVPEYVDRQIARIPQYGDDSRWRLASHLDMFENLAPDGSLTGEQRQAIDNFAIGYQYQSQTEAEKDSEMDFPECQYVAVGLDLGSAIELGDSWRRGEFLPDVGHPAADNLSNRLNQMQSRRTTLEK